MDTTIQKEIKIIQFVTGIKVPTSSLILILKLRHVLGRGGTSEFLNGTGHIQIFNRRMGPHQGHHGTQTHTPIREPITRLLEVEVDTG